MWREKSPRKKFDLISYSLCSIPLCSFSVKFFCGFYRILKIFSRNSVQKRRRGKRKGLGKPRHFGFTMALRIQSPMANTGNRIRNARSIPKSIFASRSNPINHADSVAAAAGRYTAHFPLRLESRHIKIMRTIENSKIVKIKGSICTASLDRC